MPDVRFDVSSVEDLTDAARQAVPPVQLGDRARVQVRGRSLELEVVERDDTQVVWAEPR
jgi:hypothetical protein